MAKVKSVSFKDKEQDLLDFVDKRDFSYYMKDLIRKDMKKIEDVQKPKKRKNINFGM